MVISYGTLNKDTGHTKLGHSTNSVWLSTIGFNVHVMCINTLERMQGVDSEYNLSCPPLLPLDFVAVGDV